MEIGTGAPIQTQIYALDKAKEVQENSITALLESALPQPQQQQPQSSSAVTGLGGQLDTYA